MAFRQGLTHGSTSGGASPSQIPCRQRTCLRLVPTPQPSLFVTTHWEKQYHDYFLKYFVKQLFFCHEKTNFYKDGSLRGNFYLSPGASGPFALQLRHSQSARLHLARVLAGGFLQVGARRVGQGNADAPPLRLAHHLALHHALKRNLKLISWIKQSRIPKITSRCKKFAFNLHEYFKGWQKLTGFKFFYLSV